MCSILTAVTHKVSLIIKHLNDAGGVIYLMQHVMQPLLHVKCMHVTLYTMYNSLAYTVAHCHLRVVLIMFAFLFLLES